MLFITTFNAFLNSVAAKAGTSVIDTNNDANKLNAIANAKGLNICLTNLIQTQVVVDHNSNECR